MPVFEYKALIKATGKTTRGVIDADSLPQARKKLRDQQLYPTSIKETSAGGAVIVEGGKVRRSKAGRGGVSTRDLSLLTRQFAVLLQAGMPLVEALGSLIEQTDNARLQTAVYDVRDRVNSGSNLGDSLGEHPRIFSPLYVNMVRAGEVSGSLESVLIRLADILEHQSKLRSQVISAMAYPLFMGMFAVGVIVFLMLVIVPRITQIFQKQKADLPAITEYLIKTSNFLGNWWWLILIVLFGGLGLWRAWLATEKGRKRWDRLKMRIPLYGPLHIKLVCARFTRTLGTMLQSGLTMLPALEVVSTVLDNTHIKGHMDEVKAGVRRGRDLAVPLKETGLFPPMMINMIELGQRSGEIEGMLIRVADTYDDDVRLTIEALVSLIEPLIIIVMGIFVGFIVLAILLPILQMSSNI
jgi:general secretion pathway protein F